MLAPPRTRRGATAWELFVKHFQVQLGDRKIKIVEISRSTDGLFKFEIDGKVVEGNWNRRLRCLEILGGNIRRNILVRSIDFANVDGEITEVSIEAQGLSPNGNASVVLRRERIYPGMVAKQTKGPPKDTTIKSPMAGKILKVAVQPGDKVAAGDLMFVVEAMKMENKISAPRAGTVKTAKAKEGQIVAVGEELARLSK